MSIIIQITRYAVKHQELVPWVKYIWHFEQEHGEIHNQLLPTESIDLLLNLAEPMIYQINDSLLTTNHQIRNILMNHVKTISGLGA